MALRHTEYFEQLFPDDRRNQKLILTDDTTVPLQNQKWWSLRKLQQSEAFEALQRDDNVDQIV